MVAHLAPVRQEPRQSSTARRLTDQKQTGGRLDRHANRQGVSPCPPAKTPLSRRRFLGHHSFRRSVGRGRRRRHAVGATGGRRAGEAWRAAPGHRRPVLFRPARPPRRDLAIDEINAAGGIKALGGAKIDPMLGDAQSTPEGGTAEVEKMNSAGVSCIVGGYASNICLATTQAAARYESTLCG